MNTSENKVENKPETEIKMWYLDLHFCEPNEPENHNFRLLLITFSLLAFKTYLKKYIPKFTFQWPK